MTEGQGEDGVIQFGGKGRYRRTSHLAEMENREQFHICVLQKPVLRKTEISPKLKKKKNVAFFTDVCCFDTVEQFLLLFYKGERDRGSFYVF